MLHISSLCNQKVWMGIIAFSREGCRYNIPLSELVLMILAPCKTKIHLPLTSLWSGSGQGMVRTILGKTPPLTPTPMWLLRLSPHQVYLLNHLILQKVVDLGRGNFTDLRIGLPDQLVAEALHKLNIKLRRWHFERICFPSLLSSLPPAALRDVSSSTSS